MVGVQMSVQNVGDFPSVSLSGPQILVQIERRVYDDAVGTRADDVREAALAPTTNLTTRAPPKSPVTWSYVEVHERHPAFEHRARHSVASQDSAPCRALSPRRRSRQSVLRAKPLQCELRVIQRDVVDPGDLQSATSSGFAHVQQKGRWFAVKQGTSSSVLMCEINAEELTFELEVDSLASTMPTTIIK